MLHHIIKGDVFLPLYKEALRDLLVSSYSTLHVSFNTVEVVLKIYLEYIKSLHL